MAKRNSTPSSPTRGNRLPKGFRVGIGRGLLTGHARVAIVPSELALV